MPKRKRRSAADRRSGPRRQQEMIRRLNELEEWVQANRRELALQFQRMAQMQLEIDALKKK